jgi:hypothetical protein
MSLLWIGLLSLRWPFIAAGNCCFKAVHANLRLQLVSNLPTYLPTCLLTDRSKTRTAPPASGAFTSPPCSKMGSTSSAATTGRAV